MKYVIIVLVLLLLLPSIVVAQTPVPEITDCQEVTWRGYSYLYCDSNGVRFATSWSWIIPK